MLQLFLFLHTGGSDASVGSGSDGSFGSGESDGILEVMKVIGVLEILMMLEQKKIIKLLM